MTTPDPYTRTAAALAVLAALFAVASGLSWYTAEHDEAARYSRTRDQVLHSAEQAIQNLNTLDHRDLDRGLKNWQDATAGDLHDEITRSRAGFSERVRTARTITRAQILEAAVTELDERSGHAAVIAAVEITVTPPGGVPVTRQKRLMGHMTRTEAGWKLSALGTP